MTITLNNNPKEIPEETTISTLVTDTTGQTAGVAVAVNDRIVRRQAWESTSLHDGDAVVIIKAAYGG